MIELEVLVEVLDTYDDAINALVPFEYIGDENIIDNYFYDPLRDNLKPDKFGKTFESLRIRQQSNKAKLTYKQDVYSNNIWQYSNENEIGIESVVQMMEILNHLGLKELLTINNHRRYYKHREYEIVLENVRDLGVFIEVEYKGEITDIEISDKRNDIQNFINTFNLSVSSELNSGKPELYIIKHILKL